MCFGPKCTSVSSRRRRRSPRQPSPTPTPLAVLDLSKPEQRNAHDFVQRMSSGPDTSWKLLALCRQASVLLLSCAGCIPRPSLSRSRWSRSVWSSGRCIGIATPPRAQPTQS